MVQNFMCALDLINLVYEVGGAGVLLLFQMGGAPLGPSFLPQGRPTEYQKLKIDVWVRALLRDRLG